MCGVRSFTQRGHRARNDFWAAPSTTVCNGGVEHGIAAAAAAVFVVVDANGVLSNAARHVLVCVHDGDRRGVCALAVPSAALARQRGARGAVCERRRTLRRRAAQADQHQESIAAQSKLVAALEREVRDVRQPRLDRLQARFDARVDALAVADDEVCAGGRARDSVANSARRGTETRVETRAAADARADQAHGRLERALCARVVDEKTLNKLRLCFFFFCCASRSVHSLAIDTLTARTCCSSALPRAMCFVRPVSTPPQPTS